MKHQVFYPWMIFPKANFSNFFFESRNERLATPGVLYAFGKESQITRRNETRRDEIERWDGPDVDDETSHFGETRLNSDVFLIFPLN